MLLPLKIMITVCKKFMENFRRLCSELETRKNVKIIFDTCIFSEFLFKEKGRVNSKEIVLEKTKKLNELFQNNMIQLYFASNVPIMEWKAYPPFNEFIDDFLKILLYKRTGRFGFIDLDPYAVGFNDEETESQWSTEKDEGNLNQLSLIASYKKSSELKVIIAKVETIIQKNFLINSNAPSHIIIFSSEKELPTETELYENNIVYIVPVKNKTNTNAKAYLLTNSEIFPINLTLPKLKISFPEHGNKSTVISVHDDTPLFNEIILACRRVYYEPLLKEIKMAFNKENSDIEKVKKEKRDILQIIYKNTVDIIMTNDRKFYLKAAWLHLYEFKKCEPVYLPKT